MTRRELLASLPAVASLKGYQSPTPPIERIDSRTHIHRNAPALFAALEIGQWHCLSIRLTCSRILRLQIDSTLERIYNVLDMTNAPGLS
jgi:hypothetical protein